MLLQRIILLIAAIGCVGLYVFFNTRDLGLCNPYCGSYVEDYQNMFLYFAVLLPSITLTFISQRSFEYWWRFAKYALPISFLLVVAVNFGVLRDDSASYIGDIDALFEFVALGLVYGVFTIGSLIQIVRGYLAGKHKLG